MKTQQITLRLSDEIYKQIDLLSYTQGKNRSEVIRDILENWFNLKVETQVQEIKKIRDITLKNAAVIAEISSILGQEDLPDLIAEYIDKRKK